MTAPAPALSDPRYPVGKFSYTSTLTPAQRAQAIKDIAATPGNMRKAIKGFSKKQLDTPYRDGGWSVRQVVHHVPESHMNAYIRFKLALTEDTPTIKPYKENEWSQTADVSKTPVATSLDLLESLHARWVILLKGLSNADFERKLNHPENGIMTLDKVLALYAWHGKHHAAHITGLKKKKGWK